MAQNRRRVAILMHRWVGYLHGVQLGLAEYVQQKPDWICTHLVPDDVGLTTIASMPLDGILAYVEKDYIRKLRARKVPVVDVANWLTDSGFPRVLPDDAAIGRLAGEYLSDLGLRHYAFRGYDNADFSAQRCNAFVQTLAAQGFETHVYPSTGIEADASIEAPVGINRNLLAWLIWLPKPAALYCVNDVAAAEALDLCRYAQIHVPESLCILGTDNDELLTRITHPPLSSIALHTQKIGFEAARILDAMMGGDPAPAQPVLFPPVGVIARQSTNLLAIEDESVAAAVRFIRDNVHRQVSVEDVLQAVPVNRRSLERRFRENLGRTPLEEIRRARIEKAKQLLSGSDLLMPAVAKRSGFANPERFANVFRDATGMTPTKYRREFRLHDFG
jgi:LacI family transcriptional regulator